MTVDLGRLLGSESLLVLLEVHGVVESLLGLSVVGGEDHHADFLSGNVTFLDVHVGENVSGALWVNESSESLALGLVGLSLLLLSDVLDSKSLLSVNSGDGKDDETNLHLLDLGNSVLNSFSLGNSGVH